MDDDYDVPDDGQDASDASADSGADDTARHIMRGGYLRGQR